MACCDDIRSIAKPPFFSSSCEKSKCECLCHCEKCDVGIYERKIFGFVIESYEILTPEEGIFAKRFDCPL